MSKENTKKIRVFLDLEKDGKDITEVLDLTLKESTTVIDIIKISVDNFNELFRTNGTKIKLNYSESYKLCQYFKGKVQPTIRTTKKLRDINYDDFRLLYNDGDVLFGFTEHRSGCLNTCNIY